MTSVSAGHVILTPTQPVGSGRPQRESNPGPPHQESRALPTELPPPPLPLWRNVSHIPDRALYLCITVESVHKVAYYVVSLSNSLSLSLSFSLSLSRLSLSFSLSHFLSLLLSQSILFLPWLILLYQHL